MKMGIRKELDWAYVGALLAQDDSKMQAEFIKAFLQECVSWGTAFQVETQFADINARLNPEEREALKMLSYTGKEADDGTV